MTDHSSLLANKLTCMEDGEIGDTANVIAGRKLLVLVGVDLQDDGSSGHIFCGPGDLRSCRPARPAPIRPEVDQDGDAGVSHNLVEQDCIHRKRLIERWKGILARAATSGICKVIGGKAVFLTTAVAGSNRGHRGAPVD